MANASRITALVLAHVAALGACKSAPSAPPETVPSLSPPATATAPAPVAAVPEERPTPVGAPTMVAPAPTAPPAEPPPSLLGTVCKTNAECGDLVCAKRAGAAHSHCVEGPARPGEGRLSRGRALVVDDTTHVAAVAATRSADVESLLREVVEEHASIAAFARTTCELVALGAPLRLLRETARALADEVEHTEMALAWIAKKTGNPCSIEALAAATAPLRSGPLAKDAFFRDVFRGGVVGETMAAAACADEAETGEPAMRAHYHVLADDEARHAALAVATLVWMLEAFPELAAVRDDEISRFGTRADERARSLVTPLFAALGHPRATLLS